MLRWAAAVCASAAAWPSGAGWSRPGGGGLDLVGDGDSGNAGLGRFGLAELAQAECKVFVLRRGIAETNALNYLAVK